jgi:DNA-binding GntR family transcriptional regulator
MTSSNYDKQIIVSIYEKIKTNILNLTYAPGSYINEEDLIKDLSDNKEYIRCALNWLEIEDWIIREPDERLRIKDITVKDILEIYQIRKLIEIPALQEIFTQDQTDEYADRINAKIEKAKEFKHDPFLWELAESEIHMEIVNVFNNKYINNIYHQIQDEVVRSGIHFMEPNYYAELISCLNEFVETIRAKDFDKSLKILYRDHLEAGLSMAIMTQTTKK